MTVSATGGGGTILGVAAISGGGTGAGVVGATSINSSSMNHPVVASLAFTGAGHTAVLLVVSILLLVAGVLLLGLSRRHSVHSDNTRT